jgi:hypothetical protein
MPIAVDIIFAGLLVFVPDHLTHPSLTTAYLIKDDKHHRILRFYGKVNLDQSDSSNSPDCSVLADLDGRGVIQCDIDDDNEFVEVEMRAQVLPGHSYLPAKPHQSRPQSDDERGLPDWLLHISNIKSGIHGLKRSNLDDQVGARVDFEWEEARSCELDGDEEDPPAVKTIGFIDPGLELSDLQQSVAESVLFKLPIAPGLVKVIVRNRGGGSRVISAVCAAPNCLTLVVSNSPDPDDCKGPRRTTIGTHFSHYYGLVNSDLPAGQLFLPFRDEGDGACHGSGGSSIGQVLLGCGLTAIDSAAPDLGRQIRRHAKGSLTVGDLESEIDSWGETRRSQREGTDQARRLKVAFGDLFRRLLDRVVCPPVVVAP